MKKVLLCCVFLSVSYVFAGVPNEITYQGRLRENGQSVTGTRVMSFKIYQSASGTTPVWSSSNYNVDVSTGAFQVILSPSVDWRAQDYWIETIVSSKILSPREKITSQVYALHAKTAEDLSKLSGTINFSIGSSTPVIVSTSGVEISGNIILNGTVDGVDISAKAATWDTAYSERNQWDGGASGLNATTARASLGLDDLVVSSTVGSSQIIDGSIVNVDISSSANISGSKISGWNATNWDTAYSQRNQWDGGATGLEAATGRTSLGLGDLATRNAGTIVNSDVSNTAQLSGTKIIDLLGNYVEHDWGTTYTAPKDGFIVIQWTQGSTGYTDWVFYINSVQFAYGHLDSTTGTASTVTIPIKKGMTYMLDKSGTGDTQGTKEWWIPMGGQ